MTEHMSRRTLLRQTAAVAGAMAGAAAFPIPSLLADRSPNARLAVAVIGCGGRGEASLMTAAEEKLVAIADVDDARLAVAAAKVSGLGVKPKTFFDYRRMFDAVHKDIDAVFVATPDHHHAPASMMAMQLGKHVFCEKPLCHDIGQARALAAAAGKTKVVTQMGNQGHCAEGYRRLCEYLWAGAIGDVLETHSWNGFVNGGSGGRPPACPLPRGLHWDEWLGPAPYREYHEGLHPAYWRYYWDFGTGALGDWGCHNLDGAFWALRIDHPASVECLHMTGGSDEKYPQGSIIRWEIPPRGSMPAVKVHWYDGIRTNTDPNVKDDRGNMLATVPNAPPLEAELEKKYNRRFDRSFNGGGTFYVGTKGIMSTGNYGDGPRIVPEEAHKSFPPPQRSIPRIKGTHFAHFIQCCKEGKRTAADFTYGASITEFLLLGHLAIRAGVGRKVLWDGANMRCTNLPDLNRWVRHPCRKGWEV
ncbi:MAG: Gfo/Idh/MocA family oxidoreductase [Thermoguttaceae bacterium]